MRYYLFILFISFFSVLNGQDCRHFHKSEDLMKKAEKYLNDGYKIYNQSKGIDFKKGEAKNISMVFYGEKDYVVLINTSFVKSELEFKLVDERTKQILCSRKNSDLELIHFYNESIREIIFEFKHHVDRKLIPNDHANLNGCIGILILWK